MITVVKPRKRKVRPVLDFRELNCHVTCYTDDNLKDVLEEHMSMDTNDRRSDDHQSKVNTLTSPCSERIMKVLAGKLQREDILSDQIKF